MSAALFDNTTVDIEAKCPDSKADYLFRATDSVIRFPGFTILYTEGKDEAEKEGAKSPSLPQLDKGDELELLGLFPEQNFTQPPPHFTEASLIKMLEQKGIGRPSTYAPILSTIQERGYVTKVRGSFQPTELGFVVNDLLVEYFTDIVNIEFTARLEQELDEVANENRDWVHVVQDFYIPFEKDLENASQRMEKIKLPDELTEETCPQCSKPLAIKIGRYGKFLACSGYPECKYTKPFQIKIGVKCPQCGSELIERLSRKKRTFYGCSNYPNCRFATSFRPLPQPCPNCGGLLTQYRGKQAKCTKCEYKGKLPEEK
ncbi:DNA topoisomerase 1 [subsurface metagenome]